MADRAAAPDPDELLRLLLGQARDHALLLLNPDAVIVAWLAGAEHVLGYSAAEVVGRPFTFLFTPEDVARGLDAHELAVARSVGKAEDDRGQVRKDGTRLWATGILTALKDPAGRVVGFGKVLRDRTDLKAQVEALEGEADALRQAARRKDEALAKAAHELRGPLTPLGGAAALIRMARPDDPALAGPLATVGRQVETLGRFADDLLDVTRVGLGKVRLSARVREPGGPVGRGDRLPPAARRRRRAGPGGGPAGRPVAGPGRPGPAPAGVPQPVAQRDQVHPGRRAGG